MMSAIDLKSALKLPMKRRIISMSFSRGAIHLLSLTNEDSPLPLPEYELPVGCWVCHRIPLWMDTMDVELMVTIFSLDYENHTPFFCLN